MGISAYLPLVVTAVLVLVVAVNQGSFPDILPALEMLFPIFGSWWSIFVLNDLISEPGNETLFAYPMKRWELGILRVILFLILHWLLMIAMLLCMSPWINLESMMDLAVQLGAQSFFYSALGFLAMVYTLNTGWSIIVVVCYLSLQILTRGQTIPWLDIYLHNVNPIPLHVMHPFLLKAFLLGTAMYVNAQYVLSTSIRIYTKR